MVKRPSQTRRSVYLITLFLGCISGMEENGRRNDSMTKSPRNDVAGREDRTRDRPHTRQTRIRSSYRARPSWLSELSTFTRPRDVYEV